MLEYNISGDVAARFKHAALANVDKLADTRREALPELGSQAKLVSAQSGFAMSAICTHSRPSPGVLAAAEVDRSLAKHRIDFAKSLETILATLISGTVARAAG